ncbi:MAG: hypothetical protein HFH54_01650 [Lachnospiraceae bacterium]|jgi:hypothetical protein|nr:hypothetical protein [Lachnospiraceae bacterium]
MTDTTKKDKNELLPEGTKTAAAKEKKAAADTKKGSPGTKGPRMYVGPTVPGIGIQNRVYTEIPKEAAERAKETPEIGLLFIPVRDYPMANRMLRERTGYIHDAYSKVEVIRKGGDRS